MLEGLECRGGTDHLLYDASDAPHPQREDQLAAWQNGIVHGARRKDSVNQILRDDPSKGDMNNRPHVNLNGMRMAFTMGFVADLHCEPQARVHHPL